jgi:hypothetical protein
VQARALLAVTIAIASALLLVAFVGAHPGIVAGADDQALAVSVQEESPFAPANEYTEPCEERGALFVCGRWLVDVDWRGCWEADLFIGSDRDPRVLVGAGARHLSACMRIGDYLRWEMS